MLKLKENAYENALNLIAIYICNYVYFMDVVL